MNADATATLVIAVAGPLLALLLGFLVWEARGTRRRVQAAGIYPSLVGAARRLAHLAEKDQDEKETVRAAATAADALAAAARLDPNPLQSEDLHSWLLSPDLSRPRLLLAHQGTPQAYVQVRILADFAAHPQRALITQHIDSALR